MFLPARRTCSIEVYVGLLTKRHLSFAAIFLFAGMVVNVAVAWGCGAWVHLDESRFAIGKPAPLLCWSVYQYRSVAAARVVSVVTRNCRGQNPVSTSPPSDLVASWGQIRSPLTDGPDFERVIEDARGWPLLSLWCDWRQVRVTPSVWQATGGQTIQA